MGVPRYGIFHCQLIQRVVTSLAESVHMQNSIQHHNILPLHTRLAQIIHSTSILLAGRIWGMTHQQNFQHQSQRRRLHTSTTITLPLHLARIVAFNRGTDFLIVRLYAFPFEVRTEVETTRKRQVAVLSTNCKGINVQ